MYHIYGIANCDTVRKTLKWLQEHGVPFQFHDFRKEGISTEKLAQWAAQAGVQHLLNKNSTTWRALAEEEKPAMADEQKVLQLMAEKPTLIKRPVVEQNGKLVGLGFSKDLVAAERPA